LPDEEPTDRKSLTVATRYNQQKAGALGSHFFAAQVPESEIISLDEIPHP
jgi:hypothetical protein